MSRALNQHIGICTDSSANTPPEIIERYGIEVVPLTVSIDGHEHLEGLDLDVDDFYSRYRGGRRPEVQTSEPSSGQFAAAYDELAARGCTSIVSVHLSTSISATVNQARLAARSVHVPVRVIDTGIGGVGVGSCVWSAAEAASCGAGLDEITTLVEASAPRVGTVFVVAGPELVRAPDGPAAGDGVPVLTMREGSVQLVQRVHTLNDAVASMSAYAAGWGARLRIGVGLGDHEGAPLADALAGALAVDPAVAEVVRYRIGPSVGSRTGPGTVGCFMSPT